MRSVNPRRRTERDVAMPRRSSRYRTFGRSVVQSRDELAVAVVGELDLASAPRLGAKWRRH